MTDPTAFDYEIECMDCGAVSAGNVVDRADVDMPLVCWRERCRSRRLDLIWDHDADDDEVDG